MKRRGYPPGIGDMPEDMPMWWREYLKKITALTGLLPKKPLDVLLRDLGEVFIMAPQDVVPAFASPFKETEEEFRLDYGGAGSNYIDVCTFAVPIGHAAVVTAIHQELEAITAYDDVDVRLFYRGTSDEWWNPNKGEIMPVKIVLFEKESITLQFQNNSTFILHFAWAEILGYVFPLNHAAKDQYGLRVDCGQSTSA